MPLTSVAAVVAQLHDRAFAELLLDLREGVFQFLVVSLVGHEIPLQLSRPRKPAGR